MNYSNIILIFGVFGTVIAAFFKHFWIIAAIVLILIIYKGLSISVEKIIIKDNENENVDKII